jgi:transposase
MWKPEHRLAADRRGLRYPSDLTDAEWAIVAAMIPPGRHGGRRRSVNVREVLNGIFYVLWTGCQWKALPKDLPPKSTVHDYLEGRDLGAHPSRAVCGRARGGGT